MTMKHIACKLIHKDKHIHILGIYCPLPSTDNQANTIFIDEISGLLTEKMINQDNLVILGDFNINTDDITNVESLFLRTQ